MGDLVNDPEKLDGEIGTGNSNVVYDVPLIQAAIERVSPDPDAREDLRENYTSTGHVGRTKIVSLHTDNDGLVLVENESEYASVVPARKLTTAIVVEQVPTHCGFTDAEAVAAWESLRAWVDGTLPFPLKKPTAASIQATCLGLTATFEGPCRIDPTFVVPDMDGRIPPR